MKIPAFRKKLEKEKASIDIRLKSGVKEQLAVTRESLRKLFSTRDDVQAIRDEMVTIDRMCSDPQNVVSTFDQISRVRHLPSRFALRYRLACRSPWCTEILSRQRRWSTTF